jgi:formate dehydrogenase subunit gamma
VSPSLNLTTNEGGAAPPPSGGEPGKDDSRILRFHTSERLLHWAIAGPFLVSAFSSLILVLIYNPDRSRPFRIVFADLHRASGIALIVLPLLACLKIKGDVRVHLYNIRQAWIWAFDDIKWLALMGLAAINPKIHLPHQGKFNAAEKINFMVLMVTYPLYVITGVLMWATHLAILAFILHFLMALLAVPLVSGHFYMAVINPASRIGLTGMLNGYVDRQWAKHHYTRWYQEFHAATELPLEAQAGAGAGPEAGAKAEASSE